MILLGSIIMARKKEDNPFTELSNARLEAEARREAARRRAEPFDDIVSETLRQLAGAVGLDNPREYQVDSNGHWNFFRPPGAGRLASTFDLTISVEENQEGSYFRLHVRNEFADTSFREHATNTPTTKEDLVKALTEIVKQYY